jgi:hypothetical protein
MLADGDSEDWGWTRRYGLYRKSFTSSSKLQVTLRLVQGRHLIWCVNPPHFCFLKHNVSGVILEVDIMGIGMPMLSRTALVKQEKGYNERDTPPSTLRTSMTCPVGQHRTRAGMLGRHC